MEAKKKYLWTHLMAVLMTLAILSCSSKEEPSVPDGSWTSSAKIVVYIPDSKMPDYITRARSDEMSLRAVVEVYLPGSNECLKHVCLMLTPTAQMNVYYCVIDELPVGDYDIYVWVDYSISGNDVFYNTENLQAVKVIHDDAHIADEKCRQAFIGKTTISQTEGVVSHSQPIMAKTPFAHYRIEAIDIADYERMKHANGWPELEDLLIRITYMSYVPTSFNILTGQPNDAEQGISFTCGTSNQYNGKVIVGDDYVFVTGSESSVIVKVEIINPATDEVIACAENVKIDYRQGYVTIVSGNFLTTDSSLDGAIGIDTRWEGEFNVEF